MRYILCKGSRKLPIKLASIGTEVIATNLSKPDNPQGQLSKYMLAEAQKILKSTFGYDLVCVPNALFKDKVKKDKGKDNKTYFLINRLAMESDKSRRRMEQIEPGPRGFLMVILGMFPCEGSGITYIDEADLWKRLHQLDASLPKEPPQKRSKDNAHDQLGLLTELMDGFVAQM